MGDTFLVTGDRGFVGSRLTQHLLSTGNKVVGVDIRPPLKPADERYIPLQVNLSDEVSTRDLIKELGNLKAVFHLAARLPDSETDGLELHIESNLKPTVNLLNALADRGCSIIISSTMSVFGLSPPKIPTSEDVLPVPIDAYGLAKLAGECLAERMARSNHINAVVLRYSGIFGEGYNYGAINLYATRAFAGEAIEVYAGGKLIRDYIYVDDVVQANVLAEVYSRKNRWELFHIGGGEPLPLAAIAGMVRNCVGKGEITITDQPGTFDFAFNIERARERLSFAPVPLIKRIQQYIGALQNNYRCGKHE